MSNLVGSIWDSKKGMAPVEVVADPTPASPMRWLLVRGAGGRQRHITLDGLSRRYVRRESSMGSAGQERGTGAGTGTA